MKKTILILLLLIATGLLTWYACEKETPDPPVGQTNKITFKEVSVNPSYRQAEISYSIENFNQNNVNSVGLCYNTSGEPTTDDNTVSLPTNSSGNKTIDGLSPDTEYHFRLYAEIGDVMVYSDDNNFNSKPLEKPTLTTAEVTNINTTSATSGGNITDNGGADITARGVWWSTSQNPTVSDNHTNNGTGTGSFTSELTGLTKGTTYYVQAYATNSEGTAYGEERSFLTTDLPTIDFNGTLYVYPEDNATNIEWGGVGTKITDGNGADSDTDGEANTSAIVSQLGSDGHAAYVCDTLTAYGYSDWYLPAKDELNALYQNKDAIGGFSSEYYWSSTESDAFHAWYQDFDDGSQSYYDKADGVRVRCVRRD